MAWTNLANSIFLVGKKITSSTGLALRDNLLAALRGEPAAPYVAAGWHPYDGVNVGDGNDGVIYDVAVHGAVASVVSPDFVDGYEYMLVMSGIDSTLSVDNFFIEVYQETSGSYLIISNSVFASTLVTDLASRLELYWPRVTSVRAFTSVNISGIAVSPAQKLLRFRIRFNTGNIAGGTIRMMRRLAF